MSTTATHVEEECRPINGFPCYEVSSGGRVRRITGRDAGGRMWPGRVIKSSPNGRGYLSVSLSHGGVPRRRTVHVLVCAAFHGPRPEGREVGHLDGDKRNNSATNLAWVTRLENEFHKREHGTVPYGERNGRHTKPECTARGEAACKSDLKDEHVQIMRKLSAMGFGCSRLARFFRVSTTTVKDIVNKRTWVHL